MRLSFRIQFDGLGRIFWWFEEGTRGIMCLCVWENGVVVMPDIPSIEPASIKLITHKQLAILTYHIHIRSAYKPKMNVLLCTNAEAHTYKSTFTRSTLHA